MSSQQANAGNHLPSLKYCNKQAWFLALQLLITLTLSFIRLTKIKRLPPFNRLIVKISLYNNIMNLFMATILRLHNKPFFLSIGRGQKIGQWSCWHMVVHMGLLTLHLLYSGIIIFIIHRYTLLKMGYSLLMPNFPGSAGYGQ